MSASTKPTCVGCGGELIVELDPAAPPDTQAVVLLADPPFRLACADPDCSRPGTLT